VRLIYDPKGLPGVATIRPGMTGFTNGIRVDTHGVTGVYESVEKETIVYGSETWVCTHGT
jgi:hypothetical protein